MTTRHSTSRKSTGGNHKHNAAELRSQMNTIGRDMRGLAAAAGDAAVHQLDPLEDYIRTKPIKTLLMAAGIGAIVGFLFRRR